MEASREDILKALEQVIDPELKRNVVELDMVRDVRIEGEQVTVGIALTVAGCPLRASFEEQVAKALAPVGVQRVQLEFDVMTPDERAALTARLRGSVTQRTKGIALDRSTRVLAIASGKGGVGKSTLSANLAAAFAQLGQRTGILDADVYGHSIRHRRRLDLARAAASACGGCDRHDAAAAGAGGCRAGRAHGAKDEHAAARCG